MSTTPISSRAVYGWRLEDLDNDEMILNMGPQHPSTHGVLRIELRTDGEVVRAARPHIGYLHRCFEKHAESVDYPGVIPYTDRMDYVAVHGQLARLRAGRREAHGDRGRARTCRPSA